MFDDQYNSGALMAAAQEKATTALYQPPTTRKNLENQKFLLETQLAKVDAALKTLDEHPEMEQFMETIKAAQR